MVHFRPYIFNIRLILLSHEHYTRFLLPPSNKFVRHFSIVGGNFKGDVSFFFFTPFSWTIFLMSMNWPTSIIFTSCTKYSAHHLQATSSLLLLSFQIHTIPSMDSKIQIQHDASFIVSITTVILCSDGSKLKRLYPRHNKYDLIILQSVICRVAPFTNATKW